MGKTSIESSVPQTIEALKQKIDSLNRKGGKEKIGKRALKAIENMLDHPNETAVFSISALAEKNGVNASTLTRLAKKLGFAGFNGLQNIFRHHVAETHQYYSYHVEQLLNPQDPGVKEEMMHLVAREEMSNIMRLTEQTEASLLKKAAKSLVGKRLVHILGLRASYSVAHYLAYYLGMIGIKVNVLGALGHKLAEDLAEIKESDTVVVICFRPYTKDTVTGFKMARKAGAEIVSITDQTISPIHNKSVNTLIVENHNPFFFDNTASTLVMAESLLAEVANLLGEKAVVELKKREDLFEELGTEIK